MTDTTNITLDSAVGDQGLDASDISHIVHLVIQYPLFMIGLFLHIKIIHVCNVERNKTWLVQISHAIVTTIHFGFRIPFQIITHFIPNLASHIGGWVCYIGAFNNFFAYQEISSHSLWVAIEKYILIVHTVKARAFGDNKVEKIFCWIHVIYPCLGSAIAMLTTNYATRADVKNCFGISDEDLQSGNSTTGGRGNFLFCDVSQYADTSVILSHVIQFFCVSRNFTNFVVISNIPEAFFYYKVFTTMKRQVTPMRDNHAANSLAEEIQIRNIRKVAVNARIAAVLCLLEFLANFSVVFIWIIIVGSSSAGGLTNAITWYYVILPFTHLMNTSYNKDRVVDDGWKSVILNAVKSIRRYITCSFCVDANHAWKSDEEPKDSKERESNDNMITTSNTSQHHHNTINRNKRKSRGSNVKEPDVSIISLENESNETDQRACTSNGKYCAHSESMNKNKICSQSSTDSESDDYKATKSQRLKKGEMLLSGMWHNLGNEEAYTHYFKQLLELEYPTNKPTVDHYNNFNVIPFNHASLNEKSFQPKHSEINKKIQRTFNKYPKSLKNSRFNENPLHVDFIIEFEERMTRRQNRLEGFLINCDDENAYEHFINLFISFEEGLVQN